MRAVICAIGALALASGPAVAQTVAVTDADCAKIVNYTTPPGVNYQPGVDVYGRSVAPADLDSGSQPQIGSGPITIDITADLHRYGVPSNSPLLLPGAHLGQITVDNNHTYFNGQPLGDTEEKAIADACRQRQGQHR
jgi:hypothetical protein